MTKRYAPETEGTPTASFRCSLFHPMSLKGSIISPWSHLPRDNKRVDAVIPFSARRATKTRKLSLPKGTNHHRFRVLMSSEQRATAEEFASSLVHDRGLPVISHWEESNWRS